MLDCIADKNSTKTICFFPHIPKKTRDSAINSICPDLSASDDILIFIDDSLFETSDIGIVVTKRYIYFKKRFSNPIKYSLKDIKECFVKKHFLDDSEIFINGEQVYTFDTANKNSVEKIFQGINAYVKEQPQDTKSKQGAKNKQNTQSVEALDLLDFISTRGLKGVFVKPNIPQDILNLALNKMCPDLKQDDVLVFISGKSLTGKNNIVIGKEYIYINETDSESYQKIAIKDIKRCYTDYENNAQLHIEWLKIIINGKIATVMQVGGTVLDYEDNTATSRLLAKYSPKEAELEVDIESIESVFEEFNNYIQALRMAQGIDDDEEEEKQIPPLQNIPIASHERSFRGMLDSFYCSFGEQISPLPRAIIKITLMMYSNVSLQLQNDIAVREYFIFACTLLYRAMINGGFDEKMALYRLEDALNYIEGTLRLRTEQYLEDKDYIDILFS